MASVDDIAESPRRPYKRKLTEARREQNRQAQKLWRERQKQKRDEDMKAKVLESLFQQQSTPTVSDSLESRHEQDHGLSQQHQQSLQPPSTSSVTTLDTMQEVTEQAPQPESSLPLPPLPDPDLPLDVALYYYIPPEPGHEDMRHLWPVPEELYLKIYKKPPPSPIGKQWNSAQALPIGSTFSGYPRHHSLGPITPESSWASETSAYPSPYLNHLQLVGESCFSATLSIAQSIGIARPAYLNDHPSPFTGSNNSTLNLNALPKDLRPTGYQLMLPHPCYLDCIPFPHFRSVAIYLSSEKRLDHLSLFLDLMHDGLVCWGRSRASARNGRTMGDGVAWSRRSWEARPWFWRKWGWMAKASLEDLQWLSSSPSRVDDEFDDQDAMLSGSQWWWNMNGEQDDNDDDDRGDSGGGNGDNVIPHDPTGGSGQEEFGVMLSRNFTCNVGIRDKAEVVPWD
ncbi:hypothetical protein PV10_04315 [Exophiala mesophila]|uniref:BZIP domain-containing protein n=1 Tax=Exophiala mesophila TaxID=212818 RepID=A0A0D1WUW3_EXOME|nr:uncharacterized protein PV10_04315 [Exophiala mesophila]KIV93070.1 hypothetical protein PV10_04315 [Exophiala mesophila]